jgi:hypothetical protein
MRRATQRDQIISFVRGQPLGDIFIHRGDRIPFEVLKIPVIADRWFL